MNEAQAPRSPQGTTGRYVDFKGKPGVDPGTIYWHETGINAGKAFVVRGCNFKVYDTLHRSASWLGFPVSDEYDAPGGRRNDFEGGYIYWNASTYRCEAFPNTPLPEPSVKEIGGNLWKVTLPADGNWFDTGIPIICNMEIDIRNLGPDSNDKFLVKVANKVFYNQNAGFDNMRTMFNMYIAEDLKHGQGANLMVDYDFQDTIKLKVDDEGANKSLYLTVRLEEERNLDPMHFNDSHMALHERPKRWFEEMKGKLARQ